MPPKTQAPPAEILEMFGVKQQAKKAEKPKPPVNLTTRPTTDEAKLNKMERQWLEVLRGRNFDWLGIQPFGLKLADNCRYHPDFVALQSGELIAFETKGFMRDDAAVKLKVAARAYPFIRFVLVTKEKSQWVEKEVRP